MVNYSIRLTDRCMTPNTSEYPRFVPDETWWIFKTTMNEFYALLERLDSEARPADLPFVDPQSRSLTGFEGRAAADMLLRRLAIRHQRRQSLTLGRGNPNNDVGSHAQ